MDRWYQAAQGGNISELYACIREDKEALRWIDKAEPVDTPLHIAARGGYADIAMAMMSLKPSCGRKLNQDMYSPMHIAVQNGNKSMVLGLLKFDKDLARVKGREGYTALHSAAEKGDTDLLAQFLTDCPACIEDVTFENESALHIAAKEGRLIGSPKNTCTFSTKDPSQLQSFKERYPWLQGYKWQHCDAYCRIQNTT